MRWIVVGSGGMLGSDINQLLLNQDVVLLTKQDCDITDFNQVNKVIVDADVVINCAAFTAVDDAEFNKELAFEINEIGPRNLARACGQIGAKLFQISTDYVFSGESKLPYGENDKTAPKTVYGKSKLAGEVAVTELLPNNHYIVRTAWLYGKNGKNFGKTVLELAKTKESLNVVSDQIGQPTWTMDLAKKILEMAIKPISPGIYHCTSAGSASWFEFARQIFELAGLDPDRIQPVDSDAFKRPAPRPHYSVLSHGALLQENLEPIRDWKAGLEAAFEAGVFNE